MQLVIFLSIFDVLCMLRKIRSDKKFLKKNYKIFGKQTRSRWRGRCARHL
jgi:hypothetical protein